MRKTTGLGERMIETSSGPPVGIGLVRALRVFMILGRYAVVNKLMIASIN